jgi:hypothetical protein
MKIRADRHDTEDDNFAAGLSNVITKDGQTTVTQNIPFNSKRLIMSPTRSTRRTPRRRPGLTPMSSAAR